MYCMIMRRLGLPPWGEEQRLRVFENKVPRKIAYFELKETKLQENGKRCIIHSKKPRIHSKKNNKTVTINVIISKFNKSHTCQRMIDDTSD